MALFDAAATHHQARILRVVKSYPYAHAWLLRTCSLSVEMRPCSSNRFTSVLTWEQHVHGQCSSAVGLHSHA